MPFGLPRQGRHGVENHRDYSANSQACGTCTHDTPDPVGSTGLLYWLGQGPARGKELAPGPSRGGWQVLESLEGVATDMDREEPWRLRCS